jgi:hypothetical protein
MIRRSYSAGNAVLLLMAWLVFNACVAGPATAAVPQSARAMMAQPAKAPAGLIIRRNPNLGANVFVQLWIDGQPAGSIGYGHTYQGFLPPGHHVLAVLAGPAPLWPTPFQLALDVQGGRTYSFTAWSNGSGNLILDDGRFGFPRRVQW